MLILIAYIVIFLASCASLALASKWLIGALARIAMVLQIKEFIVAFFLMAFAATVPNLMIGIMAAIHKIPELSFGDVIGGNLIDLSLVLGLGALLSRNGLPADSQTVQKSSFFTIIITVLPLLLILDGTLSRIDGVILISSFICYVFWVFSKKERFAKVYENCPTCFDFKQFIKDFFIISLGAIFLFAGSKGIIESASYFSEMFKLPLSLIGLLIVGLGNCMPEAFFVMRASKKGENWMIIGELMGGVIMCATLVLGIVSIITPIQIENFSPFAVARAFMIIVAMFFLFSLKTGHKITRREGGALIGIYVLWLLVEVFIKYFQ